MLATAAVLLALTGVNLAKNLLPGAGVLFSVAATLALLLFARATGLDWDQLGLSRHRLSSGRRWGLLAVAAVAAIYVVGLLVPATRPAFLDSRYHFDLQHALLAAFVVIPLGTVVLEEVAFRSVLWGMLERHMSTKQAVIVSSSLFGLWHVLPALDFAAAHEALGRIDAPDGSLTMFVVLGTVAFTAVGGLVFAELRRRSGSVLASAGLHWATNALGVLFGVAAWRLTS